ncbi:hypothetical protein TWF730_009651 [Orbilia blumenaviensis]|uniref:BTB domain-containing protein n=1 Tax=Orbilia blumenaviensis TaxID=1796055 RepID=A0AAV9USC1_9PEZI
MPPKDTTASSSSTATASNCATPRTLSDVIIWAYSLNDLLPDAKQRHEAIISNTSGNSGGDVVFSTPHEASIVTYSAVFAVAAAARGRPGIAVEKFGKGGRRKGGSVVGGNNGVGNGDLLREGEGVDFLVPGDSNGMVVDAGDSGGGGGDGESDAAGRKVVRCYDEGFAHVKRVYNHVVNKTAEQMDRLLDVVLKGEDKSVNCAGADFRIELEDEEGEVGGRAAAASSSSSSAATSASVSGSSGTAGYAEIHVHRFLTISSIPYYKYLDIPSTSSSRLQFSDASSNTSVLPYPTVTYLALRVIQRWLYNPLRIGEVLEEYEPNAHLYLLSNCKRQDRNSHPPPVATAKVIIEVARAADYLGIPSLARWSTTVLRKMCHGLNKCGGGGCRVMIPFVMGEVFGSGGMGLDEGFEAEVRVFLARNVESMWKRPVVMLDDGCLEELVEEFKGLHVGCGARYSGGDGGVEVVNGVAIRKQQQTTVQKKKKKVGKDEDEEEVVTKPLHWWHLYLDLNRVRISVMTSASGNAKRWMKMLLGPTMEHCVHEIARGFNDPRLSADLASKMGDGSFQKDVVVELLMMVSMSSVFDGVGLGEVGIPFEKPPLNRRTVKAVFEGIVNLRTWDGKDGEWGKAEKRVVDFLRREWMTIVASGERGQDGKTGFAGWRTAMLTVLSRKLRVSVDELLGKGENKAPFTVGSSRKGGGGRMVKDKFGNDVPVDTRNTRRTEVEEEEEGDTVTANAAGSSRAAALRPEAPAFMPSGSGSGPAEMQ